MKANDTSLSYIVNHTRLGNLSSYEKEWIKNEDYYSLVYLYSALGENFNNPRNQIWAKNNLIVCLKKLGLNDEVLEVQNQINILWQRSSVEDDNTKEQRALSHSWHDHDPFPPYIYQEFMFTGLTGEDGHYDYDYINYL